MPRKEIISTDKVTAGAAPLSQAVRYGNLVFVAGCTGRHPTDNSVGADIKEQTRYALERISAILEASGSSMDQVLTNTCYVSNREDLPGFNEVIRRVLPHRQARPHHGRRKLWRARQPGRSHQHGRHPGIIYPCRRTCSGDTGQEFGQLQWRPAHTYSSKPR